MNETKPRSRRQVVRQLALLLLAAGSIAASGPLSQFLLDHGYLDWAQYVSDRVFKNAACALVALLVVPMVVALHRERRRNPRRPGYVELLSGYNGPRPGLVCVTAAAMSVRIDERRRECRRARMQRLRIHKMGQIIMVPWLFGGMLCLAGALSVVHTLWPDWT